MLESSQSGGKIFHRIRSSFVEYPTMAIDECIFWIDSEIRANRYPNAKRVAEQFGITERSAYNHRKQLIKYGAPLETDRSRGGWCYTDTTFMLPFVNFTANEAEVMRRALLTAQEYLAPLDKEILSRVIAKLKEYVPRQYLVSHEHIGGSISLSEGLPSRLCEDAKTAVNKRQKLKILYYHPRRHETLERTIQPYELLIWQGEPHLVAYCELRQDIRQFFLGRIREWQLLDGEAAFARDPSFDLEAYSQRGLNLLHGDELVVVRAKFSAYQARWIRERKYHASQRTEELTDEGLILTLEVAGTEEVRRWLLGYGGSVEVLEPEALRQEMLEESKKLQKIYSGF